MDATLLNLEMVKMHLANNLFLQCFDAAE